MATVNDMIRRMKSLSVKDVSYKSVVDTKETVTDIQKEQMSHGLDAEGNKIAPKYRRMRYALAKFAVNPLAGLGVPDLRLTGAFYAGFQTKVTPETFATISTDEKNDVLIKKYDPFGLDPESKAEYAGKLKPVLVKNIKEKLKL